MAGEFYNLEYLNKWINIINLNKNVTFFSYTKNYNLFLDNKIELPANFNILFSLFDGMQEKLIDQII